MGYHNIEDFDKLLNYNISKRDKKIFYYLHLSIYISMSIIFIVILILSLIYKT
jgi:hypothetical protein